MCTQPCISHLTVIIQVYTALYVPSIEPHAMLRPPNNDQDTFHFAEVPRFCGVPTEKVGMEVFEGGSSKYCIQVWGHVPCGLGDEMQMGVQPRLCCAVLYLLYRAVR